MSKIELFSSKGVLDCKPFEVNSDDLCEIITNNEDKSSELEFTDDDEDIA